MRTLRTRSGQINPLIHKGFIKNVRNVRNFYIKKYNVIFSCIILYIYYYCDFFLYRGFFVRFLRTLRTNSLNPLTGAGFICPLLVRNFLSFFRHLLNPLTGTGFSCPQLKKVTDTLEPLTGKGFRAMPIIPVRTNA